MDLSSCEHGVSFWSARSIHDLAQSLRLHVVGNQEESSNGKDGNSRDRSYENEGCLGQLYFLRISSLFFCGTGALAIYSDKARETEALDCSFSNGGILKLEGFPC